MEPNERSKDKGLTIDRDAQISVVVNTPDSEEETIDLGRVFHNMKIKSRVYAWVLVLVGFVRELFGFGTLFGFQVVPQAMYEAGYMNNGMMVMPAMSLIIVGCVIWAHRSINKEEK